MAQHHLERDLQILADKGGAQHRVAFDGSLPGPLEGLDIERTDKPAGDRAHVDRRFRFVEAVDQQSPLLRRQWIDVLDLPRSANRSDTPIGLYLTLACE